MQKVEGSSPFIHFTARALAINATKGLSVGSGCAPYVEDRMCGLAQPHVEGQVIVEGKPGVADDLKQAFDVLSHYLGDAMPPGVTVVSGLFGLKDALDSDEDVFDRIEGAVEFGGSTLGGGAAIAQGVSGGLGAGGAAAGAMATAAGFFSVAGLTLGQFALIGIGKHEGIKDAAEGGRSDGFHLGFAAAATGSDWTWVNNELNVYNRTDADSTEHGARVDGFEKGLRDGFETASKLSPEQRNDYQLCVLDAARQAGERFLGSGTYKDVVEGLASAARNGTGEACVDAAVETIRRDTSTAPDSGAGEASSPASPGDTRSSTGPGSPSNGPQGGGAAASAATAPFNPELEIVQWSDVLAVAQAIFGVPESVVTAMRDIARESTTIEGVPADGPTDSAANADDGGDAAEAPAGGAEGAPAPGDGGEAAGDAAAPVDGGEAPEGGGDGGDAAEAPAGSTEAAPAPGDGGEAAGDAAARFGGGEAPEGGGDGGDAAEAPAGSAEAAPAPGDGGEAGGDAAPAPAGSGEAPEGGGDGYEAVPAPAGAGDGGDAVPAPAGGGDGGDAAPAPADAGVGAEAAPAPVGSGEAAPAPGDGGGAGGDAVPAPTDASGGDAGGDALPLPDAAAGSAAGGDELPLPDAGGVDAQPVAGDAPGEGGDSGVEYVDTASDGGDDVVPSGGPL
jgi:hypothetical protein